MRGHGREYMVKIWVLEDKYKKTHFSVDGYEPETNTVYQFHGLHCHGNMCVGNHKKRKKRQKDTCKIDLLIENDGWDTKYNLVSICKCDKPLLKEVWVEKEFMPYL